MTLALDASALVKRYVREPGRDLVLDAMAADPHWCASALARTEAMVALHQVAIGRRQQEQLWSALRDDWDAFVVVPVDDRCLARAVEIGAGFGVRTVDAVHLAAADRLPRPVRYLTFDPQQIPAAAALGFEVVSPYEE
ncbi:type II toxin-antitoxin system VapC family toxin [Actinomarinicola tropica]|uniref:Ribonuclease VapC n=1 Tax=Actinomarinicola tropica TaxID=2789776 RepID=A0A5Q2RMU9_9ACTN|nr:type II toxin-antitoxin system VapC family toxin [Actinomarinicola tropica]QGG95901.1 PIN domain-containing protein [Actinomarinicola tropica]